MTSAITSPPEQGQLVNVRSLRWVVSDLSTSTLPPKPSEPTSKLPQDLVALLLVEDDALGEELQVVWKIERRPGIIAKVALPKPTGLDASDRLDAVHWGDASTADLRNVDALQRRMGDIPSEVKK
jgi:hypothetical protein